MQLSNTPLSTPTPLVAFPCGSISINNTSLPNSAKLAPKLTVVVVLPTPPFWFVIAIILLIMSPARYHVYTLSYHYVIFLLLSLFGNNRLNPLLLFPHQYPFFLLNLVIF